MNIIFVMSLTGSCMMLFYLLGKWMLGRRTSHKLYYLWLKLCLAGFAVPLMELKYWYSYVLYKLFGSYFVDIAHYYNEQEESYVYLTQNEMLDMSMKYRRDMIILLCWVGIMLIIFLKQIIMYSIERHKATGRLVKEEGECRQQVERLKHDMGISRKITVYSKAGYASFCIGLFQPYIVVSKKDDEKVPDCIFFHELFHIKRCDILVEWIVFIVCCVHWFNPFAYLLRKELMKEMELSCDECVTERLGEEEMEEYVTLLVEQAKMKPFSLVWTQKMATKSMKRLNERIECVMKKKVTGRMMKWVTGGVMAMAVLASSFTVFAYEDVSEVEVGGSDIIQSDMVEFAQQDDVVALENGTTVVTVEFIDNNGNVYDIEDDAATWNLCPHQYVDGFIKYHIKNSDGSCSVKQYYAKKCVLCGRIEIGDLYSITTYPNCPH